MEKLRKLLIEKIKATAADIGNESLYGYILLGRGERNLNHRESDLFVVLDAWKI